MVQQSSPQVGLQSVTIMGKAGTGKMCPFDTEEVWGVNNVAGHPEYAGGIASIRLLNAGSGYTSPPIVTIEGEGGSGVQSEAFINNGVVSSITIKDVGKGFTVPPKVVISGGGGQGAEAVVTVFPQKKFHKLFAFDILPKEYTDGMKEFAPVVSWQDYADIKYPLEDVIKRYNSKYFTNTVSYMLAYAGYLNIPEVKIYGVDTAFGAPYAQENRGVEYWMGRIEEQGAKVFNPDESQLRRTVSGSMYGVADHCNVQLFLHERINLLNLLPKAGHYTDSLLAQNAWWVLFPKEDEAKANKVQVQRAPDGSMSFQCPQEYISDVHMPPESWEYLRSLLKNLETRGELPFAAITAYEKLILSHPEGGN